MRAPLLIVPLLFSLPAMADTSVPAPKPGGAAVKSITIQTGWIGLGRPPTPGLLRITAGPKGFTDGDKPVDAALVTELVAAAAAPVPRLTIDDAGLTDARRRELLPALQKAVEKEPWGKELAAKFAAAWLDHDRAAKAFDEYYHPGRRWTDDYPHAAVTITFADGKTLEIKSDQQRPLMLPWEISEGKKKASVSWSARLSRAIVALLPPKFTERERIAGGDWLADEIAREIHWQLEREMRDAKKPPAP